ncbi:L-lactate permease [Salmonella enterica subsp. enterica]|nr:L-lactate permease [Salmonella enterica subsp. enterica]
MASVVWLLLTGYGPIARIIIAAIFVYKISVQDRSLTLFSPSILSITPTNVCKCDCRLLLRRQSLEGACLARRWR